MTQSILFDIESTGLLRKGSRIHCIVARDMATVDKPLVFDNRPDQSINLGIETLLRTKQLIGHNIIGYDIPLIQERYDFDYQGETFGEFGQFTGAGYYAETLLESHMPNRGLCLHGGVDGWNVGGEAYDNIIHWVKKELNR